MESVRLAYAGLADLYIQLFGSSAKVHPDDLDLISRHLSIRPGSVLDVGCGPGHLTAYLRSLGVDAMGLDLVPEFIDHARTSFPNGRYEVGSMHRLPVADQSVEGILAWYSLIHLPLDELDGALTELRRAMTSTGVLVAGFFDGHEATDFEHKVTTAYVWPADEFAEQLQRAGFTEIERMQRPGVDETGRRPHAAIVATAP